MVWQVRYLMMIQFTVDETLDRIGYTIFNYDQPGGHYYIILIDESSICK